MQEFFHNLTHLDISDAGVRPQRFAPAVLPFYASLGDWYANCSVCNSGIFIEFDTERPTFEFDFNVRVKIQNAGFDVWENGAPAEFIPIAGTGHFLYRRKARQLSRVRIHLPNSASLTLRNLDFTDCTPVADGNGKSIVFFGDSITQCAYFPQSSMAFSAIIQRYLGGKMLNLGVGSMRYEADSLFRLPFTPDIVCVSYGCNDLYQAPTADLTNDYRKAAEYLTRLRRMFPDAKMYANTPLRHPFSLSDAFFADKFTRYSQEARRIIPDCGFTLIDGLSLVPEERRFFAHDGIHLSADGNAQYAHRLLTAIETR